MRSQWFIWALAAGVGVFILMIFNYQGKQDSVSLSEIFPDQDREAKTENIEYEFVDAPRKSEPSEAAVVAQPVIPIRPSQPVAPKVVVPSEPLPVRRAPAAQPNIQSVQTTRRAPPAPAPTSVPVRAPASIQSSDTVNAPYTIQIASFKDIESAEVALKGIKAAGHQGYIVSKELAGKGTFYRIYVGQYQTKEEANQKLSEIKQAYSSSFVISP